MRIVGEASEQPCAEDRDGGESEACGEQWHGAGEKECGGEEKAGGGCGQELG